ncbi:MAG: GNAT family N-acetyltransferase [Gemmatimonas sp.]
MNQPDFQPTLRGTLVELRPLRPDDWTELYSVASDKALWAQHPASDRYKEEVFRKFFDDALATGSAFATIDRATGRIVGSTRYYGFDPKSREIEIGWTFIARSHWGGRHNGEAKALMLDYAFQFADRVLFVIGAANRRSRMAVERIGARLLEERNINGADNVIYGIDKPGAEVRVASPSIKRP